jgi:zona occludens toxin (predicted ATPase)
VRRPRGDDGNALVEFSYLALLLMVPLVYVLLSVFEVQRASFGVTEAARQAGRAYATSDTAAQGRARAAAAAELAMRDQGLTCRGCLTGLSGALVPDGRITVTVEHFVRLPVLGAALGGSRGGIPVEATHVEHVDRFRPSG